MAEYSYFRAQGQSLIAVEKVEAANKAWEKMQQKIRDRFGATDILTSCDRNVPFRIIGLLIKKEKTPDDWQQTSSIINQDLNVVRPPKGSEDAFFLDVLEAQMARHMAQNTLHKALNIPEMPMKKLPAGSYSSSFVRKVTHIAPYAAFNVAEPWDHGKAQDKYFIGGSSVALSNSDPVCHHRYGDDYFIRVPNDASGQPLFIPPDAMAVAYDEMLDIDRKDYNKRRPRMGFGNGQVIGRGQR